METPCKYVNNNINPAYVDHLEKQVNKVRSAINLVNNWVKDQSIGIDPCRMYFACLKDIRRHIQ